MAGIPSGISTALVHLDAPISFIGDVGRIHATITSNVPLVWAATGTPIGNFIDNVSLDPGIPLELNLPHTDQAGFLDGSGNKMTGWYYRIEVTYERDGQTIPFPSRDFQILKGQTNVDLALIPGGKVTDPVVAPVGSVLSVGGHTGAVTLDKLGLDKVQNTPDLEKPVSKATAEALAKKADAEALAKKADASALAAKAPVDSPTFTGTVSGIGKSMVGLANVNNTADLDKPVSTATRAEVSRAISVSSSTRRGTAVPDVRNGFLFVTDSMTGKRKQITSGMQVLGGVPTVMGEGVLATINGVQRWVSPSGYPRPVDTDYTKASGWGSSTMQRLGVDIATMFSRYGTTYHHIAGSVGSFQISHIAAAIGIRPMLTQAFTIPAGTTPVTIVPTNLNESNNTAINVAWVGAFEGTGVSGNVQSSPGSSVWTFTRTTAGTAVNVPAGTPYIPSRAAEYQAGVTLLNPGKNTLTALTSEWTVERVIELTEEMFDFFSGAGRQVLVLGHFNDTNTPADSAVRDAIGRFNEHMRARYGGRFLDVSAYLTGSQVWTDTGITPTAADLAQQALGNKPPSLSDDNLHLTQVADEAVTTLIESKLRSLGWLNFVPPPPPLTEIADDFNREDGALGLTSVGSQPWKPTAGSSQMAVIGGNRMVNTESTIRRSVVVPPSGSQDYEVSARIAGIGSAPADKSMAICARVTSYNSYVYLSVRAHSGAEGASIWKQAGDSTLVQLGTANTSVKSAVGQVWKLRVQGNTLTAYVDGVQVITVTDASIPQSGDAGLLLSGGTSSACAWDDFSITKL